MTKYAPKREDGLMAYVVTTSSWGQNSDHIKWAESLADAKAKYGWTRQLHTSKSVRRATPEDIASGAA